MSEKISSPIKEPSETKSLIKRISFWIGFGILGYLLLGAIYLFATANVQQGWTTPSAILYGDFATDPHGSVWGFFDDGIASFDTQGKLEQIALDQDLIASRPLSLAFDSKGRIWVGTNNSLGIRDLSGEWKIFTPENNMDDARIYDMVVDGQDRVWINIGWYGSSGLSVIDPANNIGATYTVSNSGLNGRAISIAVDQQGNVWCVNENGQLMVLGSDGNWESRATLPDDSEGGLSLAIDQQGLAWVGTNGSVYHLGHDNQWTTYNIGDQGVMNTIEVLVIDHQGRVWAGSGYQGVFMFNGSADWITYDSKNSGLKDDSVEKMAIDGENKLWVGTSGSLTQFDIETVLSPNGTSSNQGNSQKFVNAKSRLPVIAFEIFLIVVLGITLSAPKTLRTINIPNFMIGLIGWDLVFGIYWGVINSWLSGAGAAGMAVIFCFIPPLPANIIAVIVSMIKPRWRWIGVGILSALVINSIGYMLFKGKDELGILGLLICVPFFIPFF